MLHVLPSPIHDRPRPQSVTWRLYKLSLKSVSGFEDYKRKEATVRSDGRDDDLSVMLPSKGELNYSYFPLYFGRRKINGRVVNTGILLHTYRACRDTHNTVRGRERRPEKDTASSASTRWKKPRQQPLTFVGRTTRKLPSQFSTCVLIASKRVFIH
jgi:hypothetical protein